MLSYILHYAMKKSLTFFGQNFKIPAIVNRSVCTPVSVMIIELIVHSYFLCKITIQITSFFYKSSYVLSTPWMVFDQTFRNWSTHTVDKNSRFLDEKFWIENSSTVPAGVVGVEFLWKLFWTRMCFQIRQAGRTACS